ncbi:MAG: cobalamin biosynthesis protein CobD [Pseudobutyrivibrio sp.]|nr:cobalamin biosynthesis protein CobD [Pseudobutyrivibrio sp.]
MLKVHLIAFVAGFILDLLLGDPLWLYHPVRLIGALIGRLEATLNKGSKRVLKGAVMVTIVLIVTVLVTGGMLYLAYRIHPALGVAAEAVLTYQAMALKSLKDESMKVYHALDSQGLEEARYAVSMIVGRDTDSLSEEGVIKAAVETVAENTSDGVTAPMLYLALGGPVLGFFYKAVNTMDSMVGYKNDRYLDFGRVAAKLDDVANFLPARISAGLMIAAAFIGGREFDGKNAARIFKRDRYKHKSPNSAQTESVCAGALGIQLAGDAFYFGKLVKKDFIGDPIRNVEAKDIVRAGRLLYVTAFFGELICVMTMIIILLFRG